MVCCLRAAQQLNYNHTRASVTRLNAFIQPLLACRPSCFYIRGMFFDGLRQERGSISICCPLSMAKTERAVQTGSMGAGDIFCKAQTVSGSTLSVYFIRWWLCMSAHSVISLEGYRAFKTQSYDG